MFVCWRETYHKWLILFRTFTTKFIYFLCSEVWTMQLSNGHYKWLLIIQAMRKARKNLLLVLKHTKHGQPFQWKRTQSWVIYQKFIRWSTQRMLLNYSISLPEIPWLVAKQFWPYLSHFKSDFNSVNCKDGLITKFILTILSN